MIPYALAAGALAAALLGWPWSLAALAAALLLPARLRWPFVAALVLVSLRLFFTPDPFAGKYGDRLELSGRLRSSILRSPSGSVYVDYYPPLGDGWVRLSGVVARPARARNPGDFDRRAWLRGKGIGAELRDVKVIYWRARSDLHTRLRRRLTRGLSPRAAALARALTLGERGALGDERKAFQRAGLAHLLALSGLHVGILVGFFVLLGAPLARWRYPLALALLSFYLLLVGPSPSLLRAALMAAVWLLARWSGRSSTPLPRLLALALALHLLLAPWAVWSLSFRLSYLAVLGLSLALPLIPPRPRFLSWLLATLAATLAAQAAILPLVLHYFNYLPLFSPLANVVSLPLVSLLVPLGFLRLIFSGGPLAWLYNSLAHFLFQAVHVFSVLPGLSWGRIAPSGFALYYLALLPLVALIYGRLRLRSALWLTASAVLAASLSTSRPDVWLLDVGQGDAALIRLAGGVEVLVDAGHDWDARRLARTLAALGVDDLDLMIGTHPDSDHTGGVPGLLQSVPVGALGLGPPKAGDELDARMRATARARGVPLLPLARGSVLRLGGATLRFLHPPPASRGLDNERSLVFIFEYHGYKALFCGDAPASFALQWIPERVNLLKVSHHGAAEGTSETLLRRFQPRLAWLSVGEHNPYGHPSRKTLSLLKRFGVIVHRSDRGGAWRVPLP